MKTFGYKRLVDLNKFNLNSVENEMLTHKTKADKELKKRNLSDEQIVKSVSKEMITAMDNWQR
ncbi:hypothetical protein HDR59_00840 [bacterium]|nr:hypothetical protein [bacterium]